MIYFIPPTRERHFQYTNRALEVSFFMCKIKEKKRGVATMDMKKLCEKLTSRPEIRDIPLSHIFKVATAIFEIIEEGECFYESEELGKCSLEKTQTR